MGSTTSITFPNWMYCGEILAGGFERMKHEIGMDIPLNVSQKPRCHMNHVNRELKRKRKETRLSL